MVTAWELGPRSSWSCSQPRPNATALSPLRRGGQAAGARLEGSSRRRSEPFETDSPVYIADLCLRPPGEHVGQPACPWPEFLHRPPPLYQSRLPAGKRAEGLHDLARAGLPEGGPLFRGRLAEEVQFPAAALARQFRVPTARSAASLERHTAQGRATSEERCSDLNRLLLSSITFPSAGVAVGRNSPGCKRHEIESNRQSRTK